MGLCVILFTSTILTIDILASSLVVVVGSLANIPVASGLAGVRSTWGYYILPIVIPIGNPVGSLIVVARILVALVDVGGPVFAWVDANALLVPLAHDYEVVSWVDANALLVPLARDYVVVSWEHANVLLVALATDIPVVGNLDISLITVLRIPLVTVLHSLHSFLLKVLVPVFAWADVGAKASVVNIIVVGIPIKVLHVDASAFVVDIVVVVGTPIMVLHVGGPVFAWEDVNAKAFVVGILVRVLHVDVKVSWVRIPVVVVVGIPVVGILLASVIVVPIDTVA